MKNLKYMLKTFAFLALSFSASGQQDAQFTQYLDNALFLNPAYAGSRSALNVTALHREQWVGMEGRPTSTTFAIHSPLRYENIGLGLTAVRDNIGPTNSSLVYGDLSYTLKFKNSPGKLAFGVKGGVNIFSNRTDELPTTIDQDPNFITNITNRVNPNFGFGVYYHTPKWFLGASTPKIIEQSYDGTSTNIEKRHYFISGGGVITVNDNWKLRPSTQLKLTQGSPMSLDLTLAGIFAEKFWIGVNHRLQDSFGAFAQFQISKQFKAGLAYDQTVTDLVGFNKGSYEVLLSYDFIFNKKALVSPRYF